MLTLRMPEENVLNGGAFGFEGSLICTCLLYTSRLLTEARLVNDLPSDTLRYNYDELGRIANIKRVNEIGRAHV